MSGVVNKLDKRVFFLSPMEFLAMSWVYKNEILPFLKPVNAIPDDSIDVKEVIRNLRSAILNAELDEAEFSESEWGYISSVIPKHFMLFAQAEKIRKPENDLIHDARGKLVDLIYTDRLGNLVEIDSSMRNGKIEFQIFEF